jgi:plasmid stabilization system protein ParE
VADSPRIEELKRRVQSDPASIAFAALAEEYRRAERFEEAIETCKAGLVRHPSYLSAHVTLGRALIEKELEYVLKLAPENLAAIRGLAEIHHRVGEDHAEGHFEPASSEVTAAVPVVESHETPSLAAAAEMLTEHVSEARIPVLAPTPAVTLSPVETSARTPPHVTYRGPVDPALAGLEEFLNAIIRARAQRAAAR